MKSLPISAAFLAAVVCVSPAVAQDKPLQGVTLNLASMNDPFATVLARLAPAFQEETGAELKVDILSYPELLTKVTADFIGNTGGYDLVTMDIVWAGQFEEVGHTVDLTAWIERDADELALDDTLRDSLRGKVLVEFPVLHVALPREAPAFHVG